MYTVFKATVAERSEVVTIEYFDNLNRARLRAMGMGMENGFVGGINVGTFDADTLPNVTDEAWGKNGRIFGLPAR